MLAVGTVCTFIECLKPIHSFDVFSCKYCGFKFCSKHRQPENHACGRPTYARKYIRKTWLLKYEQNISSGQYIVVCDTCGYVSSEPQLIELAGRELEAHISHNENCSKNTFLEEVIPPDVFKTLAKHRENIVREQRSFWVCAHCRPPRKFTNHEEYIAHHYTHS